jgi:hypothetical protein
MNRTLASAAFVFLAPLAAQSLVPAGSINAAVASRPVVLLVEDDPAVLRYATAIRDKLFAGAEIVTGEPRAEHLTGRTLLVWGTRAHPLLRAHGKELPFAWDGKTARVDGRTFSGERLRVIAAIRNPADRARTAVLYTAARAADLVGINSVFHGPTEWVVADGDRPLASGSFLHGVVLSPEAMQRDLDQLAATIAEVHPDAVHAMPTDIGAAVITARASLAAPLGRSAFAKVVAGVLLALNDAHSAVGLPSSGETIALPLVRLADGLVVAADAGELRAGDRVMSLAGCDTPALDALLTTVVSAENEHWRRHRAPALLADLGVLAALGLADAAPVPVVVERDGKEHTVQVPAGPVAARAADAVDWVRFAIDAEHSLGIFTFDRCVVDAKYRDTLAAFFRAVHEQEIRRVAVDLRRNSGGNSQVTDEFLRYVDVAEFRDFSGDVRWSAPALQQRRGSGEPRFEPAKPAKRRNVRVDDPPPFRGELFVLTGPATFSSGNWFATVMKDNGFAQLVGEPTGNAPSSFGDVLSFTLPESGTSYTLSFKRWYRPDQARDPATTLAPDHAVPRTRASVRAGSDPVLDWLRAR